MDKTSLLLGLKAFLLIFVRSVLLWLIYPLAVIVFVINRLVRRPRPKGHTFSSIVGWLDHNTMAILSRPLRFGPGDYIEMLPWSEADSSHRVSLTELF